MLLFEDIFIEHMQEVSTAGVYFNALPIISQEEKNPSLF